MNTFESLKPHCTENKIYYCEIRCSYTLKKQCNIQCDIIYENMKYKCFLVFCNM